MSQALFPARRWSGTGGGGVEVGGISQVVDETERERERERERMCVCSCQGMGTDGDKPTCRVSFTIGETASSSPTGRVWGVYRPVTNSS